MSWLVLDAVSFLVSVCPTFRPEPRRLDAALRNRLLNAVGSRPWLARFSAGAAVSRLVRRVGRDDRTQQLVHGSRGVKDLRHIRLQHYGDRHLTHVNAVEPINYTALVELADKAIFDQILEPDIEHCGVMKRHDRLHLPQPLHGRIGLADRGT